MIPKPINIHGIANSVFEFLSCWDSSERPHAVQLPPCLQAGVDCTKCAARPTRSLPSLLAGQSALASWAVRAGL